MMATAPRAANLPKPTNGCHTDGCAWWDQSPVANAPEPANVIGVVEALMASSLHLLLVLAR